MQLGAFSVADDDGTTDLGASRRLLDVIALAEAADGAGLDSFWVAEHHFHAGGVCPSPPVLLAACAGRTRRLRLGALVSVLPFHRPIDVAEEYAMVDRISGGRLNLGVGSGYLPAELEGFGIDPDSKRERFDRALASILSAWAGQEVSGDGGGRVRINVRPLQRPHPPLWVAVQRREAVAHVARQGRSIALIPYATLDRIEELGPLVREYRSALRPGTAAEVVAAVHLYAGPDLAAARAALSRYVAARHRSGSPHLNAKEARSPQSTDPGRIEAAGLALFGSAAHVADAVEAIGRLGVDTVLGIFDFGGLDPADARRSVAALGQEWRRRYPRPATGGSSSAPPPAHAI